MKWAFWLATAVIAYTYFGYPGWLWVRSCWRARPVRLGPLLPSVSIVLVVHNEGKVLAEKLRNLAELDYPADRLEVIVVSDGSTDETEAILQKQAGSTPFRVFLSPYHLGKASALNQAIANVSREVVVFTDARQTIERDALCRLVENFFDSSVGCVSGELRLGDPRTGESGQGLGMYWKIEKKIRELEAASGSVVGATGALYAVRRKFLVPIPSDTILDDVYIPLQVARQGGRVTFDSRARAWDRPNLGARQEFRRKVRTLTGNYQLLQIAPWLLTRVNPARFEFVSHKLMRLLVPFALVLALLTSGFLHGVVYRTALILQLVFYGLSVFAMANPGLGPLGRLADAALTFVVLNTAALVAFANFIAGRKAVWIR
jgi:biofilm PGA synthesis N-glycosyltransferase PgaC